MKTLAQQATVLKHAVAQTVADLGDPSVPVEYRVAEAREALEALGALADSMLRRECARVAAATVVVTPAMRPRRLVH